MNNLHTPDQFKTKPARLTMAAVGLILVYLLGSRAIDTGSWWQYFGMVILLVLSVRLILKAFKKTA